MTSVDAQFVDRIVREVMRRLTLTPTSAASLPAPPPASSVATSSPATSSPATSSLATSSPPAGTVVLQERIVAVAQLEGKLQGTQRLIVRSDAIVTPSARDLLQEKKIRWERAVGELAGPAAIGLLSSADGTAPAQRLADALPIDALQWQVCRDIDQVVRLLQHASPSRPTLALTLTSHWASLVCQANRHASIRAVAITDSAALEQACAQLDVNLLVLDPTRLAEAEILTLARLYLQRCVPGAVRA